MTATMEPITLPPQRLGKFKISDDLIRQDFHLLLPLMAQMVVVRCQHIFPCLFEYTALSDLFDEVIETIEPPQYQIEVSQHIDDKANKTYSFNARKV